MFVEWSVSCFLNNGKFNALIKLIFNMTGSHYLKTLVSFCRKEISLCRFKTNLISVPFKVMEHMEAYLNG